MNKDALNLDQYPPSPVLQFVQPSSPKPPLHPVEAPNQPAPSSDWLLKAKVLFGKLDGRQKTFVGIGLVLIGFHFWGELTTPPQTVFVEPQTEQATEPETIPSEATAPEPEPVLDPSVLQFQQLEGLVVDAENQLINQIEIETQKDYLALANDFLFKLKKESQRSHKPIGELVHGSMVNRISKLQTAQGNNKALLLRELAALNLARSLAVTSENRTASEQQAITTFIPEAINLNGTALESNPNAIALAIKWLEQQQSYMRASSPEGIAKEELNAQD